LLAKELGSGLGEQFPDHLDWHDMRFKLSYQFEPGNVADSLSRAMWQMVFPSQCL